MPNRITSVKNPSWINRKLISPAKREAHRLERWLFPNPEALLGHRPALIEGPNELFSHLNFMETSNPSGLNGSPSRPRDGFKKEVLALFRQKLPEADLSNLENAFNLQEELGINLTLRAEGIELLMMWNVSPNAVAAFILCPAKVSTLQGGINKEVLDLITWKKSLDNFHFNPDLERKQGSKFIKMLMCREENVEVLLLKTADLFQELSQSAGKTHPAAPLALHALAPFLKILGYNSHASQLEDLAFLNFRPAEFKATESQTLEMFRFDKAYLLDELKTVAECLVEGLKTEHEITWGPKNIYQTYLKEQIKDVNDFLRLRVVVKTEEDCFNVQTEIISIMEDLGYRRLPQHCDDYINAPTSTRYRALHETFEQVNEGWMIEIQIRSEEMHREAEVGSCSHLSYKLRQYGFGDLALGFVDAREQYEFNRNRQKQYGMVYAYDADGRLHKVGPVTKPGGEATVLDFAFHLSRDAGRRTVGAEIIRLDHYGNREKITAGFSTHINSGDRISLKIANELQPITRRRLDAATTEIAIASLGLLRTGKEIDLDRRHDELKEIGSKTFNKEVEQWEKKLLELFDRLTGGLLLEKKFHFSNQRVFKKLGLPDLGTFYTAVGLRAGKSVEFLSEVMSIIQNSSAVAGFDSREIKKGEATLYILLSRKTGVILRLLKLLKIYDIILKDFSIGASEEGYTLVKLKVRFGTDEKLPRFLNKLEDLYKNIPLLPQSPHQKQAEIRVRLKEEQLLGFLEMLLQLGGQILSGNVQTRRVRKTLDAKFKVAFPTPYIQTIADRIIKAGKKKYKKISVKEV